MCDNATSNDKSCRRYSNEYGLYTSGFLRPWRSTYYQVSTSAGTKQQYSTYVYYVLKFSCLKSYAYVRMCESFVTSGFCLSVCSLIFPKRFV